jgi:transcription elongation factor Elf1
MASVKKNFACDHCDAQGSITIKSKDFSENDIRSCPICGTPLLDDIEEDEE